MCCKPLQHHTRCARHYHHPVCMARHKWHVVKAGGKDDRDTLHRFGFVVVRGPRETSKRESAKWFIEHGTRLPGGEGRWRHQPRDNTDMNMLRKKMTDALQGLMGKGLTIPAGGVYGIRDEPGTGPQELHVDWGPQKTSEYESNLDSMPLSVLWACSEPFCLATAGVMLRVGAGDMIVFRGDFVHGGGGHLTTAFRVHAYVAPRGVAPPGYIVT